MNEAALPCHEVYAVRYATVQRRARDNFLLHDAHDAAMDLDFYFWVIKGAERVVVVDTGFSADSARRRQRSFLQTPEDALARLRIDPQQVDDLIITHLHYDHAGNVGLYPRARVHLQDAEMQFATGRYMCHPALRHFFAADDVVAMVRRVYDGDVRFHDGDAVVAPGIELYRVGGHTAGLQIVRVMTPRGWVVLASDALHYYRNYQQSNLFPSIFHVGEMLEGYRRITALAPSADHVIPGHDPLVARRYPAHGAPGSGIHALHVPPGPEPEPAPEPGPGVPARKP